MNFVRGNKFLGVKGRGRRNDFRFGGRWSEGTTWYKEVPEKVEIVARATFAKHTLYNFEFNERKMEK